MTICYFLHHSRPPKVKSELVIGVPTHPEPIAMRPTNRIALINNAVEKMLKRQKEEGRQWEDEVEVSNLVNGPGPGFQ